MRCIRNGQLLLVITLGISFFAWGQGGGQTGRGAAAQQAGAAGRGGRGGAGASDFYNYDTAAGSGQAIPDVPPAETHQKITINGETLAYTARAGYMPLRNATTGQSEAHLFFTSYTKDGVSDAVGPSAVVLPGRRPGRGSQLAGVWRLGSEADEVGGRRHRRTAALWLGGQSQHPARPG